MSRANRIALGILPLLVLLLLNKLSEKVEAKTGRAFDRLERWMEGKR